MRCEGDKVSGKKRIWREIRNKEKRRLRSGEKEEEKLNQKRREKK